MAAPTLVDVATAIADGTPLDWSAGVLRSENPELRSVLNELKIIERIARVHAAPVDRSTSADYDSLLNPRAVGPQPAETSVTWGPLTIVRKIGRGAFGDVYLAHDPRLDRPVALKLMRRRERGSDAFESEIIDEGRLLARVNHPNVVTVHGAERIDGRVGLWMAFVEGQTLADDVKARGPFPSREVIEIGVALADALEAVHAAGLLHRDIKAQNAMRDATGRILLTDFGAGREMVSEHDASEDGPAGTPLYLAPEVLEGAPASKASDVYSLGVLLFHLATGGFPVQGRTLRDLRDAHTRGARTAPRTLRPDVPRRLAAIVDRAIDLDPARRYESAAELRAALTALHRRVWSARGVVTLVGAMVIVVALFWRLGPAAVWPFPFAEAGALTAVPIWRIWDTVLLGNPAPDGRWLPCTIQPPGPTQARLARCDLRTGNIDAIGDDAVRARPYPKVSPDGRYIAYMTRTAPGLGTLRIVAPDGTGDRSLLAEGPGEIIAVHSWSADGTEVLATRTAGADRGTTLAAISIRTGAVRDAAPPGTATGTLSPSGRHLLFARRNSSGRFDLWTKNVSIGTESRVVDEAWGYEPRATWTPSGAVLYTSDRAGTLGLWRVDLNNGVTSGAPQLIRDTGRYWTRPYGFTADGTLVHGLNSIGFDSYIAGVTAEGATVESSPRRLAAHPLDANATPAWSPDGEWIAYVSERPGDPAAGEDSLAGVIVIRHDTGRDERRFHIRDRYQQTRLRWWPDGKSVILLNGERRDRDTGEVVEQLLRGLTVYAFEIDAERRRLYYLIRGSAPNHELRVLDLDTRVDRLVMSANLLRSSGFSLSADGRTLAMVRRLDSGFEIHTVPINGGDPVLVNTSAEQPMLGPFTPDGRHLFFSLNADRTGNSQVFVLDLGARRAAPLDIVMPQIWQMQLHRDGRRLAFVQGSPAQELFAMKGALVR